MFSHTILSVIISTLKTTLRWIGVQSGLDSVVLMQQNLPLSSNVKQVQGRDYVKCKQLCFLTYF